MSGNSKSQVSRLCAEIDDRVNAFLARPIAGDWPYLWIDATYLKVRRAGRIVSVAAIIAVAVNTDGVREVLGMAIGPFEAEPFWTDFLRALTRRGLRGVKLVISDAHEGLKAAAAKVLSATWQRCRVQFLRDALAHAGKGQRQMVLALINTSFAQETADAAVTQWHTVADQVRAKFPKLDNMGTKNDFMERCWARNRPMICLAAFSGMRPSEYRGLSWDHVHKDRVDVRQRADKTGSSGR